MNKDPLAWGRYVAVAGAYAACYELTRYFSFSHWVLVAGLRLACLMLVPRKYWAAMVVGETLPIVEMAAINATTFGPLWAVVASVPPILLYLPVVAWLQNRVQLVGADGKINMSMVMLITLICAGLGAADNLAVLATVVMQDGSHAPAATMPIFLAWFLGNYLGALTLTPTVIALRERLIAQPRHVVALQSVLQSKLTRDAVFVVAPILALLWSLASQLHGTNLLYARAAMALPVIVLTWRHGWHGSAVGGMLASIVMASTSFELRDPAMIQAQIILAFVISTSLLFGVRVARRLAASHGVIGCVSSSATSRR